jgi:Holliday junction resolvase RusA-like endonuclease
VIKITLPIPASLSSNRKNGHHWSKFNADKGNTREEGYYTAIGLKNSFKIDSKLKGSVTFFFKDKIRRDIANFFEGMKSQIDGIFLALGCDDSQIDKWELIRGDIDKNNPRVELEIDEI